MLRVFIRAPSLCVWSFFLGLGATVFQGGMVVPWVGISLWTPIRRGTVLLWACLIGACWGAVILPMDEKKLSWSAWFTGDGSARVVFQTEEVETIAGWRRWATERLQRAIPAREASLAMALLYGENTFSSRDRRLLQGIGLTHLTAVSGANLSFLLLFLLRVSGWRHVRFRWRVWLQQGLIFWCVLFTGASSSMVRAGVMASLGAWAPAFGCRPRFLRSLLLAALFVACVEPRRLFVDLGWQFSALACIGLATATRKDDREAATIQALRVSFFCWAWTVPLQLWRFQSWSWIGFIATPFLVPIIEIIQVGSLIVIIAPFSFIGGILTVPVNFLWRCFEMLAVIQGPLPPPASTSAYLLLYIPLVFALIHKSTGFRVGEASDFFDTSLFQTGKTIAVWIWNMPNLLDTSPDLVMIAFVSMLKRSARNKIANAP